MGDEELKPFSPAVQVSEESGSSLPLTRPISEDREVKPEALTISGWRRWLPGLQVLREYQSAWLARDLMAGLVLTAMLVPVGIAYALASGVPGIYGLYATIVPLPAYALFVPAASWC